MIHRLFRLNPITSHLRLGLCAGLAALAALAPAPALAAEVVTTVTTITTVIASPPRDTAEDVAGTDPALALLLADEALAGQAAADGPDSERAMQRFAPSPVLALGKSPGAAARFGPFTVGGGGVVRMAGDVTAATPRQFAALLTAHPGVRRIDMIDCPGSLDEAANLRLARMIRQHGIATHVPSGGSVRSGAVELWLAGAVRTAADDAEFGVHSWQDEDGLEARDYPADHPVHREYLDFYREMGMDDARARAFYQLTNSTGFASVRLLSRRDMAAFAAIN